MASWAAKRKLEYLSIVATVLLLFVVIPVFVTFYKPPTCTDGKKNGGEAGVDCGGSCTRLCSFEALSPIVLWSRAFRVTDDMWTAVAYVENPNITSEAYDVPYTFKIYDKDNVIITERSGTAYVPRNKRFIVFEGKIPVTDRKPRSAKFEFTQEPIWVKSTAQPPDLAVKSKALLREEISPRIEAELQNNTLGNVDNVEVSAIIYDGNNNAVGASRTFVERIAKAATKQVVFTWPQPFEAKLDVCEIPTDVMLVLDRSGSMKDDGENPPQPLTDAKQAAKVFIDQLRDADQAGLVSFATLASDPIDSKLSGDPAGVKAKIDAVAIGTVPGQNNTNLGGGLLAAFNELSTSRHNPASKKVIVGLTDGLATEPAKKGDPKYPDAYASEAADKIKADGVQIYMIGLGNQVNASFLQSVATSKDHYYSAVTSKDLQGVYKDIATKICKKRPAVIEIITRVLPKGVAY